MDCLLSTNNKLNFLMKHLRNFVSVVRVKMFIEALEQLSFDAMN